MGRTADAIPLVLAGVRGLPLVSLVRQKLQRWSRWSEAQDDRPANGMALCRMCHWTFDEGLLGVSQVYEVIASRQLNTLDNLPGYLTNLEGRGIVGPDRKPLWPDTESLQWHRENVLRTR